MSGAGWCSLACSDVRAQQQGAIQLVCASTYTLRTSQPQPGSRREEGSRREGYTLGRYTVAIDKKASADFIVQLNGRERDLVFSFGVFGGGRLDVLSMVMA